MININKMVVDTLRPLGYPVSYRKYSGNADTYITFFEVSAIDDDYSNDENETYTHRLQIDLWSKEYSNDMKIKIREALKEVFCDVSSSDGTGVDADETHITFECFYYEKEE